MFSIGKREFPGFGDEPEKLPRKPEDELAGDISEGAGMNPGQNIDTRHGDTTTHALAVGKRGEGPLIDLTREESDEEEKPKE